MESRKGLNGSESDKSGIKAILVPTDFSGYSDAALKTAIDVAHQQDAMIYLLHVVRSDPTGKERKMIEAQVGRFAGAGSVKIVPDVRKGVSYREILKVQEEMGIDLIIIPSKIKKRVRAFSKCSMLVVAPK